MKGMRMSKKVINLIGILTFGAVLTISAGVFQNNKIYEIEQPEKSLVAGATTKIANIHQEAVEKAAAASVEESPAPVEEVSQAEPEVIIEEPVVEPETTVAAPSEYDLLVRTVYAEGYTLGKEGMQYICDVIINRAEQNDMSITDAIYQRGVFTVVTTGAIWNQDPLPLAYEAVDAELIGPRLDTEILYFRTKYYHSFGTPCFHYKNVYFSK
jgi:spore germination cell wall hydrolase CwlJ-like protein